MIGLPIIWWLRTLAFATLALVVFGAIEFPPLRRCNVRNVIVSLLHENFLLGLSQEVRGTRNTQQISAHVR